MSIAGFLKILFAKVWLYGRTRGVSRENVQAHPRNFTENEHVYLKSFTDTSVTYELTPRKVQCSCPDWQKRRAHLPEDSPGRLCKHLVYWYAAHPRELPTCFRDYKAMIDHLASKPVRRGFPCGEACRYGTVAKEPYVLEMSKYPWGKVLLGKSYVLEMSKYPWVNVMVGKCRYGYNFCERRWSYGAKPSNRREIEKVTREALLPLLTRAGTTNLQSPSFSKIKNR